MSQQIAERYPDVSGQISSSTGHYSETSFPPPGPPEIQYTAQADQQFLQQIAFSPDPLASLRAEFSEEESHSQVVNPGYFVDQREPQPERDDPDSVFGAQTETTHPSEKG